MCPITRHLLDPADDKVNSVLLDMSVLLLHTQAGLEALDTTCDLVHAPQRVVSSRHAEICNATEMGRGSHIGH